MPWVRLDEEFPDHPKVALVGVFGLALQVAGLCYSNRHLTDGFVPLQVVRKLCDFHDLGERKGESWVGVDAWDVAERLVMAGIWDVVPHGFRIHNYADYQPLKVDVQAERVAQHEAKVAGGKARAAGAKRDRGRFLNGQVNTSTTSSPPAAKPAGPPAASQQPTSPVPETPSKGRVEGTGGRGGPGGGRCLAVVSGRKRRRRLGSATPTPLPPREQSGHLRGVLRRRRGATQDPAVRHPQTRLPRPGGFPMTPLLPLPDLDPLTSREVADAFGADQRTVILHCRRGRFPGAYRTPGNGRGPGDWRIPHDAALAVGRELGVFE